MRITKFSDYSLRVLICLGLNRNREQLVTISELAETYGISRHHVRSVVHKLGVLGYVENTPGKGGGARLAKDPASIRIGDVVKDLENDFDLVECFKSKQKCLISPSCKLPRIFAQALSAFIDTLNQYTLADLIKNEKPLMRLLSAG